MTNIVSDLKLGNTSRAGPEGSQPARPQKGVGPEAGPREKQRDPEEQRAAERSREQPGPPERAREQGSSTRIGLQGSSPAASDERGPGSSEGREGVRII